MTEFNLVGAYEAAHKAQCISPYADRVYWSAVAAGYLKDACDVIVKQNAERKLTGHGDDNPVEEIAWKMDLDILKSSNDDAELYLARKWHAAYRKAQNSNLLRKQEIERLRADMENYGDDYVCQMNDLRSRAQTAEARIQELEDALAEYQRLGKTIAGKGPC